MALLARYRRFWIVAVLCLLAVPAAVQLVQPRQTASEREARTLALLPSLPQSLPQWPAWAPGAQDISEYDLMMQALATRHVSALDLRPVLRKENAVRSVYRGTDTHWNKLGALVAYDEVVDALHRPDWRVDSAQAY